jgi:hypothetical protein
MNATPSTTRLLRRSRLVAWGTAAGACAASAGLIFGITHTASQVAAPATSTGSTSTGSSTTGSSTTGSSTTGTSTGTNLGSVSQGQAAQGGSHGS